MDDNPHVPKKTMSECDVSARLVNLKEALPTGWRSLYALIERPCEHFLGIDDLNDCYRRLQEQTSPDENFYFRAMQAVGLSFSVSDEDLARIPREGPVIAVANHPYGGIDGIVLGALLASVRSDSKLLANALLGKMEEMAPWLIAVNPFGGKEATRENLAAMKETLRFLKDGGCIGTFPAGTVSHLHLRQRQITDPLWHVNTAGLVRRSGATVVPVFFEGNNSLFFQLAGMLHPRLRTLLLVKELFRLKDRPMRLRIGRALSPKRLAEFDSDEALIHFLRLNTYVLRERADPARSRKFPMPRLPHAGNRMKEVAEPIDAAVLEQEIEQLDEDSVLIAHGQFSVYLSRADRIPNVLLEIGRLREKTFRDVGEGTGLDRDLDDFDVYYHHLFMWDHERRAIVGAYRVGLTDEILAAQGRRGLYTSTLFRYKQGFLEQLDPALELGRSFIVSEYQRKHASLSLIWKAIGRFVVRNPRYRRLFGPVSISHEYTRLSKDLMVQFLKHNRYDRELASLVKAKRPPRRGRIRGSEKQALRAAVRDIDDVSALVAEVERDSKGVPVLLRHYLKMNGRILSFNVDPAFGQCLDGLIVIDLVQSDPRLLKIYLSEEGTRSFLDYHDKEEETCLKTTG